MCNIVNREATCVRRLATGRRIERLGTLSITFTANDEPEEVTSPPLCCQVRSLRFRFRREEVASNHLTGRFFGRLKKPTDVGHF